MKTTTYTTAKRCLNEKKQKTTRYTPKRVGLAVRTSKTVGLWDL